MFMDSTSNLDVKHVANNAFVQFQVWDFPGDFDFGAGDELVYGGQVVSPQVAFAGASALVFVVDAQVNYSNSRAL
jgi:Ras-related GTP-binding protein C/D